MVDVEVVVLGLAHAEPRGRLLLDPQLHLLVEPPLATVQLLRRIRLEHTHTRVTIDTHVRPSTTPPLVH